jgi:hypothetical protein
MVGNFATITPNAMCFILNHLRTPQVRPPGIPDKTVAQHDFRLRRDHIWRCCTATRVHAGKLSSFACGMRGGSLREPPRRLGVAFGERPCWVDSRPSPARLFRRRGCADSSYPAGAPCGGYRRAEPAGDFVIGSGRPQFPLGVVQFLIL